MYDSDSDRNLASVNYINQGLEKKHLCVYASVNAYDKSYLAKITSQIKDYEDSVNKRKLLIENLKPFFDSELANDLTPFEEFKTRLQQELKDRDENNKDVLIIADCADNLFSNKHFDQCNLVEKWWQDIYMKWQLEQQKKKKTKSF